MREITEPELTTRIRTFLEKKTAKFRHLRHDTKHGREVPLHVLKHTRTDANRQFIAM